MKLRDFTTPRRVIALSLVLIGCALQIAAAVLSDNSYLNGVGIGLLVLGLIVEVIGQAVDGRDQ